MDIPSPESSPTQKAHDSPLVNKLEAQVNGMGNPELRAVGAGV
jgi:hypothetical protein